MIFSFAAAAAAQDATTLALREAALIKDAVVRLHGVADALQGQKQHARALTLRRTIWMDYDEDDQRAREKSGFVQVGRLWRVDEAALVLDRDLKAKRSKLRKIERDLAKLEKSLLAEHRALAAGWTKLDEPDRAARHWRRVLAMAPGDPAAAAALSIREFEGFTGTADELRMLRRGRAIHLASDWLIRTEFDVQEMVDARLPLLEAAGVEHAGVRTEHFQVWGALPLETLMTLAQDCERSLLLFRTWFGVASGSVAQPKRLRNLVFVQNQSQYAATMEVCRGAFSADRFAFLRDHVDMCFLEHNGESLRVYKGELGLAVCRDNAVRGVMQDAVGPKSEGLWEGVGHAACGFLFKQTLCFLTEQLTERTSTGHTQRRLMPDLDTWMRIATESAWSKSDTRSSELVLIRAARFTNEQRVKAWAICHYLAHWRPEFILDLDASKGSLRAAPDVEAEFERRTGYPLPRIDAEWRAFWGRGATLRAAMTRDPLPNKKSQARKAIERSRELVDALNLARAEARVGPLGYYLDTTPDFLAVRRYEKALAKAEKEQAKRDKQAKSGRKVEPVVFPRAPAAVGTTVLWSRAPSARAAIDRWLLSPAQRDKLIAPGRDLVAVPSDLGGYLLGVSLPAEQTTSGPPLQWPRGGQGGVRAAVGVEELDARARAALQAAGVAADASVGAPLTVHFARDIAAAYRGSIRCQVLDDGRALAGVLVDYSEEAPGCFAFVPTQPLPAGRLIEVRWSAPTTLLGKGDAIGATAFRPE
ncbi:MAG: hypothetical protein VYA51_07575 [Planctomycetota bacterium]|nr:hypothetical protein [Planctomycetota bacterium]